MSLRPSRRALLRGVGAAIALPWLPSLGWRRGAVADDSRPVRTVFVYMPNGILPENWIVEGTDTLTSVGGALSSLSPHLERVLVIEGLANRITNEVGGQPHSNCTGALLTGAHVSTLPGASMSNTRSIDQLIADRVAPVTRWSSLALTSEWPATPCIELPICQYAKQISWAGSGQPVPIETSPANLFEKLFGGTVPSESLAERGRRIARRGSILDQVSEDASSVRGGLSTLDQQRMDQYLDSVRAVELRLDQSGSATCAQADPAAFGASGVLSTPDHVSLMLDLIHLAFTCDQTRVVTYMLGIGGSDRTYTWLGSNKSHHEMTHLMDQDDNRAKIAAIETWCVSQYAALLDRLASTPDGEGTLLDSCQVVFCNEMGRSDLHYPWDLPVIVAGGAAGQIRTGRRIVLAQERSVCDLWTSLARHHGVTLSSFGVEGTGPLPDLG